MGVKVFFLNSETCFSEEKIRMELVTSFYFYLTCKTVNKDDDLEFIFIIFSLVALFYKRKGLLSSSASYCNQYVYTHLYYE
jgi:hypothetical protein